MSSAADAAEIGRASHPGPPPTTHATRLHYLDGWRGISILAVLVGHFLLEKETPWLGSLGVELFFVLSGRLMADILFVERFPLGEFYKRRLSRIYPGLMVFVVLVWCATQGSDLAFKPVAAVTALTFTINYAMALTHGVSMIENLWSLCIEEHAYLLLGALAFLVRRRGFGPMPALLAVAAASILDAVVSTVVFGQSYFAAYWRTDAHLASIFLAAAAYLHFRDREAPAWLSPAAFVGGVAVAATLPSVVAFSLGTGLLAVAVATLDRAPGAVRAALSWRWLTRAGVWSYSIYLWQQPFFRLERSGRLNEWIALALTAACGLASFYLVEQPARRWLNAHWRLRGAKPPLASAKSAA